MPPVGLACKVVVSPSQRTAGVAEAVAVMPEPSMLTVTCAVLLQPPCGLVTVTVNVVVSCKPMVAVFCEVGLTTLLAGCHWKLNCPPTPALAESCDEPPYMTTVGVAEAEAIGAAYTGTV